MKEKDFILTPEGQHDINVIIKAINAITSLTIKAFVEDSSDLAHRVEPLEEVIDGLIEEVKVRHIARLQRGECNISKGYVFNDLLTNFERVSDHCSNIAEAMLELESEGAGNVHEYTNQIKKEHLFKFETYFNEFKSEYSL